jgi:perosamine synthetase
MTTYDLPTREFLEVLTSVIGPVEKSTIALHEPNIGPSEHKMVAECLSSGWVSSVGEFITRFENQLSKITGAAHVIAIVNGTCALHLALHSVGIKPGDEVIIPSLSFVATANAVAHCGATPHFADSDPVTLGLDPIALRKYLASTSTQQGDDLINTKTGARIGAIVPMHTFGHPMHIEKLSLVAKEFGLPIVEDAAESLGSFVGEKHTGTFGRCGILSFNGNKTITTGGGGAILTNDESLALKIRHLATTAKLAHEWEFMHDKIAWNFRMPNINAALGCAQLDRLDEFLLNKRNLAKKYDIALKNSETLEFVTEPKDTTSNYWLNTVRLKKPNLQIRNELLTASRAKGYLCRPAWNLLHQLPMYDNSPRADLPVAQMLLNSLINVPSSANLGL